MFTLLLIHFNKMCLSQLLFASSDSVILFSILLQMHVIFQWQLALQISIPSHAFKMQTLVASFDWSKFDVNIQTGRLQVRLLMQGGLHLRSSYPKYTFQKPLILSVIAIKMDKSPFPSGSAI